MVIFVIIVPIVILVLLILNLLFAPSRPDPQKQSVYECGFISFHQTRSVFNISFYLVGILFLVFDLEVALLYPLAISLNTLGSYGFWICSLFLVLLTLGFVYELGSNALKITKNN